MYFWFLRVVGKCCYSLIQETIRLLYPQYYITYTTHYHNIIITSVYIMNLFNLLHERSYVPLKETAKIIEYGDM